MRVSNLEFAEAMTEEIKEDVQWYDQKISVCSGNQCLKRNLISGQRCVSDHISHREWRVEVDERLFGPSRFEYGTYTTNNPMTRNCKRKKDLRDHLGPSEVWYQTASVAEDDRLEARKIAVTATVARNLKQVKLDRLTIVGM